MNGEFLSAFLTQVIFTIGVIVVFGMIVAFCNKLFYKNMGSFGKAACYITGFIGTPVHECAHALMCLIFGHKITEIKLFQINSDDGTLGYVCHSYNKKNLYQNIGNFFIGVAPIIVISAVLYLLSSWLVPGMMQEILFHTQNLGSKASIGDTFKAVGLSVGAFFSYAGDWHWWVFLLIGMFLVLHMTLSGADIKGAWGGALFLLLLLLVVDFVFELVSVSILHSFTGWCLSVGGYLCSIFALSLIVCVLALVLSYVFKLVFKR